MRKKRRGYPVRPVLLFALSGALLLLSTVGSTRAALTYYSENYEVKISVPSIGVSLVENGDVVSHRNYVDDTWQEETGELLTGMLEEGEKLTLGKTYREELSVENSGTIDSYVRVILYRYWTKDGEAADTELSPKLIGLHLIGENWVEDPDASTPERTILYYTKILPSGQRTPAFCDTLRIDPSIGTKVTETRKPALDENGKVVGTTVTTAFAYDGYRFNLKAEVDAVQTHSAAEAIKSAWGVDVSIAEDGTLSLIRDGANPSAEAEESGPDEQS